MQSSVAMILIKKKWHHCLGLENRPEVLSILSLDGPTPPGFTFGYLTKKETHTDGLVTPKNNANIE